MVELVQRAVPPARVHEPVPRVLQHGLPRHRLEQRECGSGERPRGPDLVRRDGHEVRGAAEERFARRPGEERRDEEIRGGERGVKRVPSAHAPTGGEVDRGEAPDVRVAPLASVARAVRAALPPARSPLHPPLALPPSPSMIPHELDDRGQRHVPEELGPKHPDRRAVHPHERGARRRGRGPTGGEPRARRSARARRGTAVVWDLSENR